MDKKNFNLGLVVGRFEPIHLGHEKIINMSLASCNKTALFVTYDKIDNKNPYPFEYVLHLINKIYKDQIESGKLKIIPFKNDISFDEKYGEKIVNVASNTCLENPDYIVYGSDKNISKCFNENLRKGLFEKKVNRDELFISATDIRNALKDDNIDFVKKCLSPKIHDEIENLMYYNNKNM